jgi:ADP-ribosyl-[dinitrogen reductase] hydrolase
MKINAIFGSVVGDIIGSVYEFNPTKDYNFEMFNPNSHFTDDSVLTMSVAKTILEQSNYDDNLIRFYKNYPDRKYGPGFLNWINTGVKQNSFGNGAPMRVSAIGNYFTQSDLVLSESSKAVEMTHSHPEGIKGAQAIALAIFMAKRGYSKKDIKEQIQRHFLYDLNFSIKDIKDDYSFNPTSQGSVPQSLMCFFESNDFESAIRLAISLGGDSDTLACMTGGISSVYYKDIPSEIICFCKERLPDEFIQIINMFD